MCGMKLLIHSILYWASDYLPLLGLMLNYVKNGVPSHEKFMTNRKVIASNWIYDKSIFKKNAVFLSQTMFLQWRNAQTWRELSFKEMLPVILWSLFSKFPRESVIMMLYRDSSHICCFKSYLPVSQTDPMKPGLQVHAKPGSLLLAHVPFWHGKVSQISACRKVKSNPCSM